MIELVSRNVLLKGSHRKQILAWLRRSLKLGEKVGNFVLTITIERIGRCYQVQAQVKDQAGSFQCRTRGHQLLETCRDLVHMLSLKLHDQRLQVVGM